MGFGCVWMDLKTIQQDIILYLLSKKLPHVCMGLRFLMCFFDFGMGISMNNLHYSLLPGRYHWRRMSFSISLAPEAFPGSKNQRSHGSHGSPPSITIEEGTQPPFNPPLLLYWLLSFILKIVNLLYLLH